MNWFIKTVFYSSIGKKITMSLTGLFLCSFLVVHLSGNLQLLSADHGLSFNIYAVFMTTNPLIKTISYGLYAIIVFHAIMGLYLAASNKNKRTSKYAVYPGSSTSFWASRWMGVLGTLILVFVVTHMAQFWFEYKFGKVPYVQYAIDLTTEEITGATEYTPGTAEETANIKHAKKVEYVQGNSRMVIVKDLYREVYEIFKSPLVVLLYVLSMFALAFHLMHGFKSAFQTLGLNHNKYNGLIRFVGLWIFSIIIPALFALLPVYIYLKQL